MKNEGAILKRAGRHSSPGFFTYDPRLGAIDDYCAASEANDIGGLLKTLAPDVELISPEWPGAEAYKIRDGKIVWSESGFRDKDAALDAVAQRKVPIRVLQWWVA